MSTTLTEKMDALDARVAEAAARVRQRESELKWLPGQMMAAEAEVEPEVEQYLRGLEGRDPDPARLADL